MGLDLAGRAAAVEAALGPQDRVGRGLGQGVAQELE